MGQDSRDFLMIARRVSAIVGDDYIEGLVQQKQYEWFISFIKYNLLTMEQFPIRNSFIDHINQARTQPR